MDAPPPATGPPPPDQLQAIEDQTAELTAEVERQCQFCDYVTKKLSKKLKLINKHTTVPRSIGSDGKALTCASAPPRPLPGVDEAAEEEAAEGARRRT